MPTGKPKPKVIAYDDKTYKKVYRHLIDNDGWSPTSAQKMAEAWKLQAIATLPPPRQEALHFTLRKLRLAPGLTLDQRKLMRRARRYDFSNLDKADQREGAYA